MRSEGEFWLWFLGLMVLVSVCTVFWHEPEPEPPPPPLLHRVNFKLACQFGTRHIVGVGHFTETGAVVNGLSYNFIDERDACWMTEGWRDADHQIEPSSRPSYGHSLRR